MKVLIVYASNSGNTLMVAERIAETLKKHAVTVSDVVKLRPKDLQPYDAIVFGSCTWERQTGTGKLESQLPQQMFDFAAALEHHQLPDKHFAVFGLGRHEYTGFCSAANHLAVLVHKLGGKPLLPPLKIDGFPHHQLETVDQWTQELNRKLGGRVKVSIPVDNNPL